MKALEEVNAALPPGGPWLKTIQAFDAARERGETPPPDECLAAASIRIAMAKSNVVFAVKFATQGKEDTAEMFLRNSQWNLSLADEAITLSGCKTR
jgi:hypothetical protein